MISRKPFKTILNYRINLNCFEVIYNFTIQPIQISFRLHEFMIFLMRHSFRISFRRCLNGIKNLLKSLVLL